MPTMPTELSIPARHPKDSPMTDRSPAALWKRYQERLIAIPALGFRLDASRMDLDDAFLDSMTPRMESAFAAMRELEGGSIANPDEGRMVGHYWLRDPDRAPTPAIRDEIRSTLEAIRAFAREVHAGAVRSERGRPFVNVLVIGIGGSALGPQFVADALGGCDRLRPFFCDNTDPDGMDRVRAAIGEDLAETLCLVISKSGGTAETRNGQLEFAEFFRREGLSFARAAVAVTGEGSALDRRAREERWLRVLPMWDWVGGRTSELSAVGLLPAALQGIDIGGLLDGARAMDAATRVENPRANPAAMLALSWFHAGAGRGDRDMVVLPYKDRLLLFSKYLQQLVMESLGKERDLAGNVVHQGISVYGNKGSTDQHAYVQQLRDGPDNFFATFVEVRRDRAGSGSGASDAAFEVEPGVTSGDYLAGFLLGTRRALFESGRQSLTISVEEVSPRALGALIALFERAVGLYATLVGINAYHQPGVEAGKKAAAAVLALQHEAVAAVRAATGPMTADEIAASIGRPEEAETVFHLLERAVANGRAILHPSPDGAACSARYEIRRSG